MNEMIKTPEFLFESSWEVCNKVGGIYTVLSTKAHTLQQIFNDKVIFIGPDVWANTTAPDFTEDASLFEDWRKHAEAVDHLKVKVGRWNVPGTPPVILEGGRERDNLHRRAPVPEDHRTDIERWNKAYDGR